ncbi:MAG: TolB family protein, partial [Streptosporangiaceae bacterium]
MTELLPLKVIFGNPERIQPSISPDGTQLAWIAPHQDVLNVWVAPVASDGVDWSAARVVTDDTDRGIRDFTWAHDGRHLMYVQDTGGDENWRLHDVDLITGERRDLTPFENVQVRIVATEPKFPTEVLVGLNRDNPQRHDVYRLDLVTGELTKELENPGFVDLVADASLVVRAGMINRDDGSADAMVRDGADGEWRLLFTIPAEDALTTQPIAFSTDGGSLLALSSLDADTARLVSIDVATGATEVLAGDPEADVIGIRLHPQTREPQIVTVLKDRLEYLVLDPSLEPDLAAIRALHRGDLVSGDGDDTDATWLIAFNNDTGSVAYFSYDRASRTGRFLFEHRPELSRYELAPMEPFSFTARDGLTIHGYATF